MANIGPQALETQYNWLRNVQGLPKMIAAGLETYGVHEQMGATNSPTIMAWRDEVNKAYPGKIVGYSADSIPWCGLWMALICTRTQREPVAGPLWALNWKKFGADGGQPELGDILIFVREGGGHVGMYVGEDKTHYHVLGGNTSDSVKIARIEKKRLQSCRQPVYTNKPASVKPYILAPTGGVSTNEA